MKEDIKKESVEKPKKVRAVVSTGKVKLRWEAATGAEKYKALAYNKGFLYSSVCTANTAAVFNNLINGEEYCFLVRAFINKKWSDYCDDDFICAVPAKVSEKPENITAESDDCSVHLKWEPSENAEKYRVFAYDHNGEIVSSSVVSDYAAQINGLESGTTYSFLVKAFVDGEWVDGDIIYASTAEEAVFTVSSQADGCCVTLSWNNVRRATKYKVFVFDKDGVVVSALTVTENMVTFPELDYGTAYGFLVRALVHGKWKDADKVYVNTGEIKIHADVQPTDNSLFITWNRIRTATRYRVFVYDEGDSVVYSSTVTEACDTAEGLCSGKLYRVLVRALINGEWLDSDTVSVSTTGTEKLVLKASPGDGRVRLSWNAKTDAIKYKVYVFSNGSVIYSAVYNETTAAVKNLVNGAEYCFLVSALVNGAWIDSDIVYATPKS